MAAGFSLGDAANYAFIELTGAGLTLNNSDTINGDVGTGGAGAVNFSTDTLNGNLVYTGAAISGQTNGTFGSGGSTVTNNAALVADIASLEAMASIFAAETGTALTTAEGFTGTGSGTVTASSGTLDASGNEVFTWAPTAAITSQNFTISGSGANDVVIDITSTSNITLGNITLTGGITAGQVLFNFINTGKTLSTVANTTQNAILLDSGGTVNLGASTIVGGVYGGASGQTFTAKVKAATAVNSSGTATGAPAIAARPTLAASLVQKTTGGTVLPNGSTLTFGETVDFTLTIQPGANDAATAYSVMAELNLDNITVNTASIVVTDPNSGATHTIVDTSTGFNLNVGEALSSTSSPITVTFSGTVSSTTGVTSANANALLSYNSNTPGDEIVYGSQQGGTNFYEYDVTTSTLVSSSAFPGLSAASDSFVFVNLAGGAQGIIFTSDNPITNAGVVKLYNESTHVTTTIFNTVSSDLGDIALSPDGKSVYFGSTTYSGGSPSLYKIDISSGNPATYVTSQIGTTSMWGAGQGLAGLAFTPNGDLFAVLGTANGYWSKSAEVVQLNPSTGAIINTITGFSSSSNLDGMCYDTYSGNLWVACRNTTGTNLYEINPNTLAIVDSYSISGLTTGLDGIVSDGLGNLFTEDYQKELLQINIKTDGSITTTVLKTGLSYIDDPGPNTPLSAPGNSTTSSSLTDTVVSCFMAGTLIRGADGDVAIEDLKIGDLVASLGDDGAVTLKPVRWIGRGGVARADIRARPLSVAPIRIQAGALGENTPARDLLASPCHAFLIDGVLVQAGAMVNGSSITREFGASTPFMYYHVELDDHAMVFAEGAPAETFIDNADRLGFDNWEEHLRLYPTGKVIDEAPYPRVTSARQCSGRIKARLAARAEAISQRAVEAA